MIVTAVAQGLGGGHFPDRAHTPGASMETAMTSRPEPKALRFGSARILTRSADGGPFAEQNASRRWHMPGVTDVAAGARP